MKLKQFVSPASLQEAIEVLKNTEGPVTLLAGGTVPLNTEGHIKVIMRCYFDGALEDGAGTAYVNSNTVKTQGVVIGVEFFANESEESEGN